MNRILAETLTLLNGLIAVVIILIGLFVGYRLWGGTMIATLLGGVAGFILASLSCGALAYLALIERHLSKIAGSRRADIADQTRRDPIL